MRVQPGAQAGADAGCQLALEHPYNDQMQTEFTQHALNRMAERGISQAEVLETLAHPMRILKAANNRFEAQGWIDRAQKRRLLRVICEHGMVITVVTVMATSKLEKYGVV